jgi:hypothetical protein
MARYYFHAEDGRCFEDEEGIELPDMKTAAATALKVLAEHLQSSPGDFWKHDILQVHLTDARGLKLLTLSVTALFSSALAGRSQAARPE